MTALHFPLMAPLNDGFRLADAASLPQVLLLSITPAQAVARTRLNIDLYDMVPNSLPQFVNDHFLTKEVHHASAVLERDFPEQWSDLLEVLTEFRLYRTEIEEPGGSRSPVAIRLDRAFQKRGWKEHGFETSIKVDDATREKPTHKVDNVKGRVAIDPEWNNKDPFFDRDLNNFRTLFERGAISVGVIITRASELQALFKKLGKGDSYGSSTTHWEKLVPRLDGDAAGGCPVLAFGITEKLYIDNVLEPNDFIDRYYQEGEKEKIAKKLVKEAAKLLKLETDAKK
jgi:hypothetical protein